MNKKTGLILILILFLTASFSFSKVSDKQNAWIKAAAEKDATMKLQLFEAYKEKYGGKKDKNTKFLYFNLAQTSMALKKFEKVIEYGEKALTFEDLEDSYKLDIALWLANAFNLARKDYDKAYSYADMVIDLGKSLKGMADGREQADEIAEGINKRFIAPAFRIQIWILKSKGISDDKARMDVVQKGIAAHNFDKSNPFPKRTVLQESVELARKNKINEAIDAIEKVVDLEKLNFSEANLLAQLFIRRFNRSKTEADKDKTIFYFEEAYKKAPQESKKKKGGIAVKIGRLLSKKDKDKAIKYFAEAFVLLESDKESDAYKYLQQLWFKEVASDKTPEEQEAGFKQIIDAAKTRLGTQ